MSEEMRFVASFILKETPCTMSNKVTNMLLYYVKYMRYYIVVELESINCCVSQTK